MLSKYCSRTFSFSGLYEFFLFIKIVVIRNFESSNNKERKKQRVHVSVSVILTEKQK